MTVTPLKVRLVMTYITEGKSNIQIHKMTGVSLPTIRNMRKFPGRYVKTAKKEGDYLAEFFDDWNHAVNQIRMYLGKKPIEEV